MMLSLILMLLLASVDLEELSLDRAMALGVENSPAVKRAEIAVDLANVDLRKTAWWRRAIPRLGVGATYNPLTQESDVGIGIGLSLRDILAEGDTAKEAGIQKIDREVCLHNVRQQVEKQVAELFLGYQLARDREFVYEAKLEDSVKLAEIAKLRFEQGMLDLSGLLQAQQSLLADRLNLLQAQARLFLADLELRRVMGELK